MYPKLLGSAVIIVVGAIFFHYGYKDKFDKKDTEVPINSINIKAVLKGPDGKKYDERKSNYLELNNHVNQWLKEKPEGVGRIIPGAPSNSEYVLYATGSLINDGLGDIKINIGVAAVFLALPTFFKCLVMVIATLFPGRFRLGAKIFSIRFSHKWLLNYGLARIPKAKDTTLTHYIFTLNMLLEGYKAEFLRSNDSKPKITITLFFPGTRNDLMRLYENDEDVQDFVMLWNNMASEKTFIIRRAFICNPDDYKSDNNLSINWYSEACRKIDTYVLDARKPEVSKQIKDLRCDNDFDFVIFQGGKEDICVGLIQKQLMYVLLQNGEFSDSRKNLLNLVNQAQERRSGASPSPENGPTGSTLIGGEAIPSQA